MEWADRLSTVGIYKYSYKIDSPFRPRHEEIGVLAHELENVDPLLIWIDSDGTKRVDHRGLAVLTLKANQELRQEVLSLKRELEEIKLAYRNQHNK